MNMIFTLDAGCYTFVIVNIFQSVATMETVTQLSCFYDCIRQYRILYKYYIILRSLTDENRLLIEKDL